MEIYTSVFTRAVAAAGALLLLETAGPVRAAERTEEPAAGASLSWPMTLVSDDLSESFGPGTETRDGENGEQGNAKSKILRCAQNDTGAEEKDNGQRIVENKVFSCARNDDADLRAGTKVLCGAQNDEVQRLIEDGKTSARNGKTEQTPGENGKEAVGTVTGALNSPPARRKTLAYCATTTRD